MTQLIWYLCWSASWRVNPSATYTFTAKLKYLRMICFFFCAENRVWHFILIISSTLCMLGNFACFFAVCGFFFRTNFFKKNPSGILSGSPWVSNGLDPDQAWHVVRPDLGPNCMQRLSADNKLSLAGKKLKVYPHEISGATSFWEYTYTHTFTYVLYFAKGVLKGNTASELLSNFIHLNLSSLLGKYSRWQIHILFFLSLRK